MGEMHTDGYKESPFDGNKIIGPGLIELPVITTTDFMKDMKIINCKMCLKDYGLFINSLIISSSVDCPFCAEGQPHMKHINGIKLPLDYELTTTEEKEVGFYNCEECGDQIHTSHLPLTKCNICLSTEDEEDVINWPKHYNTCTIQPIDVIEDWKLDFRLANSVKYIQRHKHKGSAKKDLEKAIWYIQRYIDKELTKDENNG